MVRAALLPLTLKAKAASANVVLFAAALQRASAPPGDLKVRAAILSYFC